MKPAALLASMLLMAACGSGGHPTGALTSPSGSPTASASVESSASPSAVPAVLCSASNRCLALVTLRGSNGVAVRDITDINHPVTVSTLPTLTPVFVTGTELSYADDTTLYRMPLSGSPKTIVAKANGMRLFGWSSDGSTAGYLTADGLHVVTASRDQTFGAPLNEPAGAYGCESYVCGDTWDARLAFSPDGAYISVLVLSGPWTGFRIWSSDGKLLPSPTSQAPTMSVWSGRTFYFRDTNGVEAWRDGVTSVVLPGVQWIRPKSSPAGGGIVYEARDGSGLPHVYLVDTVTHEVSDLKAGRTAPAFLTSRYVWYAGERLCVSSDPCVTGPTIPTGKTYIYDLQTGTEYESIITNVYDVWPHAA